MDRESIKPVVLISPLPPPLGGIATWTQLLCQYGLPTGDPILLINTRLRGNRPIFARARFSFAEIYRNLVVIWQLSYYLITKKSKIVHLNCALSPAGIFRDALCAALVRAFSVPLVVQYHGNLGDFAGDKFGGYSQRALAYLFKTAQLHIFINQASLQLAGQMNASMQRTVLANFIADEIFTASQPGSAPSRENERLQVIFAGGMTKAKGVLDILALAQVLPHMDFNLYGKVHADVQAALRNASANIILHGEAPHQQLLAAFKCSDLLLFPSYSEGFPLTVLEAMALGLPVIATNVGAISEMIMPEGGYVVAPGDVAAMQNALMELDANAQMRQKMGEFNRQKSYTHYRYSVVSQQLAKMYGDLCAV